MTGIENFQDRAYDRGLNITHSANYLPYHQSFQSSPQYSVANGVVAPPGNCVPSHYPHHSIPQPGQPSLYSSPYQPPNSPCLPPPRVDVYNQRYMNCESPRPLPHKPYWPESIHYSPAMAPPPPPPSMLANGLPRSDLSSMPPPSLRSPNGSNGYLSGSRASPASNWSHSPGLISSPRATPSPLPPPTGGANIRSTFSPTPPCKTSPSVTETPLQSLQKMVMIDADSSDSSISRTSFERASPTSSSSVATTNGGKFYSNQGPITANGEHETSYPTYYNLDQNRICTPPREPTVYHEPVKPNEEDKSVKEPVEQEECDKNREQKTRPGSVDSFYSSDSDNHGWKGSGDERSKWLGERPKIFYPQEQTGYPVMAYTGGTAGDVRIMPPPVSSYHELSGSNGSSSWSDNGVDYQTQNCSRLSENPTKKKRGRPFGSKNKPKIGGNGEIVGIPIEPKAAKTKKSRSNGAERSKSTTPQPIFTQQSVEEDYHQTIVEQKTVPAQVLFPEYQPQSTTIAEPITCQPPSVGRRKNHGPYVHVERSRGVDVCDFSYNYSIVNMKKVEDDTRKSEARPSGQSSASTGCGSSGQSSTPGSNQGNWKNAQISKRKSEGSLRASDSVKDSSWFCIFCKQGSHYRGLGDLFGPYYVNPVGSDGANIVRSDQEHVADSRRDETKRPNVGGDGNGEESQATQEVWFHEECIVWSNGVYLVGNKIRNIDEVVRDCAETVCCKCKLTGASLGCLQKGCQPRYHYLCAREKGCDMDEENFSVHCPKHKKKITDRGSFY